MSPWREFGDENQSIRAVNMALYTRLQPVMKAWANILAGLQPLIVQLAPVRVSKPVLLYSRHRHVNTAGQRELLDDFDLLL